MCDKKQKVALSDLILEAICYLQEKNGVTACEIAEFIADRRGCKISQIEGMVKMILCKAKAHEILSEKKGLYRIEERYDDAAIQNKKEGNKAPVELPEDSEEEGDEDEDDEDAEEKKKCDPCACLKLSQENLSDDEEDNRCAAQKPKKRKCC